MSHGSAPMFWVTPNPKSVRSGNGWPLVAPLCCLLLMLVCLTVFWFSYKCQYITQLPMISLWHQLCNAFHFSFRTWSALHCHILVLLPITNSSGDSVRCKKVCHIHVHRWSPVTVVSPSAENHLYRHNQHCLQYVCYRSNDVVARYQRLYCRGMPHSAAVPHWFSYLLSNWQSH